MTTLKYIKGEYLPSKWHSLEVGDIVKVEKNQVLPADLIIYSTSDPNGICYIETSNLDGERNLKTKQSI
jgi:P-type E1-E2 ATPase